MNITAGEPVPPGFEEEVNRLAEIQPVVDQFKGKALIGLEYTLELREEDRREPGYICVLCDKRGDTRTIMQHWTSHHHRLKYLEKHYPTAVREFNPVKYKPNSHNIMVAIVQSLAEAIEDHHGRLALSTASADDFRRQKSKICNEINEKFHYDERNGPNFLNAIDRTLWEKKVPNKLEHMLTITLKAPIKRGSADIGPESQKRNDLDEISSDSDGQSGSKKTKKREQSPAYRVQPRVHRSPPFEEERGKENEKKLPTPKELSLQASHIAQERYKWEKYRCMLEIQLKAMEKEQQQYIKNPEKHPMYSEEWKKFWNRRYKELQLDKNIDPNKYDYKPEWIVYWGNRIKTLFNIEVDKKKKEIKAKLCLPDDAEEKVDQLKEKYKVQVTRNVNASGVKLNDRTKNDMIAPPPPTVIDISDDEDTPRHSRNSRRSRSRSRSRSSSPRARREHKGRGARTRTRSHSRSHSRSKSPHKSEYDRHHLRHRLPPVSRNYPHVEPEFYGVPSTYSRSRYPGAPPARYAPPQAHYRVMDSFQYPKYDHSPSPHSKSATKDQEPEPEETGPLTVVAVLRLLTALEEHLGSLGPKVVDLLGKALALEKLKANSADDMLMNEDHCVFFETIKEKLKGLLIADMLEDQQKVRAVKKAIKNIAAIVHQVTAKGKNPDPSVENIETKTEITTKDVAVSKMPKKIGQNPPNVKDLPFDRQVVSTKLAAALVMQGREDISTDEMDKLIYMFVLLVKLNKSKINNEDTEFCFNDVLLELGIAQPKPPSPLVQSSSSSVMPGIIDDNDVIALVKEVEEDISNDNSEKGVKFDSISSPLESLTDSDLQTLLQNFKHLSSEEQHHLIAHLKKLESADGARVEKLRKFVNLSDTPSNDAPSTSISTNKTFNQKADNASSSSSSSLVKNSRAKPNTKFRPNNSDDDELSQHQRVVNVANPNKFSLDDEDEDDDYNFDDVFKAAATNVNRLLNDHSHQSKHDSKSSDSSTSRAVKKNIMSESIATVPSSSSAHTFNPAGLNISLSDTQNLIANLMGSLQQSNKNLNSSIGVKTTQAKPQSQPVPPLSVVPKQSVQAQSGSSASSFYQQNPQQSVQAQSGSSASSFYQQNPQQHQQQQQLHQQHQQHQQQQQHPQHQQQQQQLSFNSIYNQMDSIGASGYYNTISGYNNSVPTPGIYTGYPQQWGNGQQMSTMQQFNPQQGYMNPQQQQQQQQPQQQMSYNMYGHGIGN